jgi:hypothetical protein
MAIGRPILDIVYRYLVASDIYAVVGWYPIAIGFANQRSSSNSVKGWRGRQTLDAKPWT